MLFSVLEPTASFSTHSPLEMSSRISRRRLELTAKRFHLTKSQFATCREVSSTSSSSQRTSIYCTLLKHRTSHFHSLAGCCTSCAVRVKSGEIRQSEALGISAELKSKGYALLCVGFPTSDLEVETQDEDEVYWLQFGRYFARGPIERDDYALELALGDE